jgi:hypothetical protein
MANEAGEERHLIVIKIGSNSLVQFVVHEFKQLCTLHMVENEEVGA